MGKLLNYISVIFLMGAVCLSCSDGNQKRSLPSPSGSSGEVVIWCSQGFWDGEFGDSVKKVLRKPVYGLPQSEPLFDLQHATDKTFGSVFKTFANIIVIELDPDRFTDPVLNIKKNIWAKRQVVVEIKAKSRVEAAEFFLENANDIIDYLNTAEQNRLIKRYKDLGSKEVRKYLKKHFDTDAHVMKDAYIAKKDSGLVWIRNEREKTQGGYSHQISQGIVIAEREYRDKEQLQKYAILNFTDSILQKTVPGPVDGSYMHIDESFVTAKARSIDHYGNYAIEMSGLWQTEGYIMGGPWYALHVVNTAENKILSAYGYVYAPQFKKREYLREVQAAIKSIKFYQSESDEAS